MFKRLFLYILLLFLGIPAMAQYASQSSGTSWFNTDYNTSEGTDFWVTFMRNSGSDKSDNTDMTLYVYATARKDAKVTITNPNQNAQSISFNIKAGEQVKQQIPNSMGYMQIPKEISNFGLHVTSTEPISLYATSHHNSGKYDGTNVLPTKALVGSYMLQTYINDQYATEFALVATTYQTIDIHLVETTLDQAKFNSGILDTIKTEEKDTAITLSPGQTYLYRSSSIMTSLSGSTLCSTRPFALIQGGQSTKIPGDPENHIFHQSYSNDQWGKTFVVTPTFNAVYDYVRITACEDNTHIWKNGILIATIHAKETFQDTIVSSAEYVTNDDWKNNTITWKPTIAIYTTSKATTCYLFATGYNENGASYLGEPVVKISSTLGAPTMTPIIPQEEAMHSTIFATFNDLTQTIKHYVNIVTLASEVSGMRLDGVNISGEFKKVPNNDKYSYLIKEVTGKAHTIQNVNGRVTSNFTARVYGLGMSSSTRESYAYSAGSRVNRSIDLLINDQYIKEKTICINQSLKFTSIINQGFSSRQWLFGDGTTNTDSIVAAKKWNAPGDYIVSLLVTKTTPICDHQITDTVKALIHVRDEYKYKNNSKLCKGDTFTISGYNDDKQIITYTFTEDTKKTLTFKTSAGCDSIVELDIQFGEPDPKTETVTNCDSYTWNSKKYTSSGIYTYDRTNIYHCDVTDTLKLTILKSVTGPETHMAICEAELPYTWEGQKISKAGTYTAKLTAANGCDSTATIIVTIEPKYKNETTKQVCPAEIYQWRGQTCDHAGDYTSHGSSPNGCDSTFILHFSYYPTYNLNKETSICEGEKYTFGDTTLTTSGTYKRTLKTVNGCDSTVTLQLTVYPAQVDTIYEQICSNETYPFDGKQLNQTGTYTMQSQTEHGCGKTTILHLIVLPTTEYWDTVTVCQQNLPYTYCDTKKADKAGDYTEILKKANQYGCDSTYHLHLIVNPTLETTLPKVYRCDYEGAYSHPNPAAKNLQNLTQTGIYKDTLTSITGCDSVLILPFNWSTRTYYDLHVRVCQDELPWEDPNSTTKLWRDTTYNDTITNAQQCDSVITVHFSVAKVYTTTIDTTICEMEAPYMHPDPTATDLQNLTTSGTYKQRIPSMDECDSTIVLNLTVLPTTYRYETIIECESNLPYIYGEHQKKAFTNGTYRDTLISKNQYGCDSILEVNLTVLPTIRDVQYDTICDSDVPYNHLDTRATRLQNLTTTGVYYDTLKTLSGCDSILELHLFVPHAYYGLREEVELCDNGELYWNDLHLLGSWGVGDTTIVDTLHTIYGCDSVITLTVHIWPTYLFLQDTAVCQDRVHTQWEWIDDQGGSHGFYPINVAGEFVYGDTLYSIHGCDSVFGVRLTVHPSYRFDSVYSICDNEQTTWQHKTYQSLSAGVYYDTVAFTTVDGCDSIFYLVLNVYPTYEKEVEMTLCENELPYYFTYADTWGAHVDSIVLGPNEQFRMISDTQKDTIHKSITKVLRTIHNCDSVVHFDITIHPSYQYVERGYICWDGYYEWRDSIYNKSGVYFDSLYTDIWGCDSTYVLELFVKPVELIRIDTAICDNETLSHIDTLWYTKDIWAEVPTMVWQPGMSTKPPYWDIKFLGADSCDSIVYRYYVDIHPTYLFRTADTLCSNEFYPLHNSLSVGPDTIYDPLVSGYIPMRDTIYSDSLVTINGCDSVYWLDAHICPYYLHIDYDTICDNQTLTWRNHTIQQGLNNDMFPSAGDYIYQDIFVNSAGCDSIYQLKLCVHPTYHFATTDSTCVDEPYPWQYRSLQNLPVGWNAFDTTYATIFGCDSTFHLDLFVLDTTFEIIYDTICQSESYILHGVPYTQTGDYKDTTLNAWGCHHFTYLHLTVIPPTSFNLYMTQDICADDEGLEIHYDYDGRPLIQFSVYFDSLGHSQGFHDIIHEPLDTVNRTFFIPFPSGDPLQRPTPTYFDSRVGVNKYVDEIKYQYPQPDRYPVRIVMHNGICTDPLQTQTKEFDILYPSWIHEQHWNDGIVLYAPQYNGGHEFTHYQWYHNSEPIIGQVREFLYLPPNLELNPDTLTETSYCPSEYSVLLTRQSDGHSAFTCPICPVLLYDTIVPTLDYYSVVPTLVVKENPVVWILSTVKGEYHIYIHGTGQPVPNGSGTFAPDEKNYAGEIVLPSTYENTYYDIVLTSPNLEPRTCIVWVK